MNGLAQALASILASQHPAGYAPPTQTSPSYSIPAQPAARGASDLQSILPVLALIAQGADAVNSSTGNVPHLRESTPVVAPFSHGGLPMYVLGGALLDLLKHRAEKNESQGRKNTSNIAQILAHIYGIEATDAAERKNP